MQDFYNNNNIIAENLRNTREYELLSKRQTAEICETTAYYITIWENGSGKIPHNILRIFCLWARCTVEEFIFAEQSIEDISRRNCLFEARTTAEIPRKYCDQKKQQIF